MDIEFFDMKEEHKKLLLDLLGYCVDDKGVIIVKKTKKPHICPLTGTKIKLSEASILPWNSYIVVKTSAVTLSEYITKGSTIQNKS